MEKVGLKQALNGFEADLLVMNSEFERKNVPGALADVLRGIIVRSVLNCALSTSSAADHPTGRRAHAHPRGAQARVCARAESRFAVFCECPFSISFVLIITPSVQLTKSISTFLAQNRTRNDASNRAEFLHSLTEKSKRPVTDTDAEEPSSSCARTDAKPVDRAAQMKYDIARNVDGPLRRTTRQHQKAATDPAPAAEPAATRPRTKSTTSAAAREAKKASSASDPASEKERQIHSGLDGRITDIETHFAVRYGASLYLSTHSIVTTAVPAPPSTLLARLRFLEEHIIKLEKDYPPWAALHFNQPNRGVRLNLPSAQSNI